MLLVVDQRNQCYLVHIQSIEIVRHYVIAKGLPVIKVKFKGIAVTFFTYKICRKVPSAAPQYQGLFHLFQGSPPHIVYRRYLYNSVDTFLKANSSRLKRRVAGFSQSLLDPPAIHRAISAFFKSPFLHRNFFVRQGAVQRQLCKPFFVTTKLHVHRRSAKIFSFSEGFVLKGLPSCCKLLLGRNPVKRIAVLYVTFDITDAGETAF